MINNDITAMSLDGARSVSAFRGRQEKLGKEDQQLKDACNSFESLMTSMIMKEGMKSAQEMGKLDGDEERDQGSETYMEIASEQMADYMGKQGIMGLGELLYQSVKTKNMHITQGNDEHARGK